MNRAAGASAAIVFDFAGVVFHWQPLQLLQRVLPQHATDASTAAAWAARIFEAYGGDWAEFDRGTLTVEVLVQRIAARTGLAAADVQRVVDAVPLELQPLPATVALLRRLHAAGRALFYLSNMPAPYARHLVDVNPFLHVFADGVFSARVQLVKPEPAIYALAQQRFGRAPHELVFLDDHAPNVAAARSAGWNAIRFADAAQAEAALRDGGWL